MVSEEEFQRFIENDFESQEEFFEFLDSKTCRSSIEIPALANFVTRSSTFVVAPLVPFLCND